MKTAIKTATVFFALSIVTSSCALFRGGGDSGGHCPAYGSTMESDDTNVEIKNVQEIRENSSSM